MSNKRIEDLTIDEVRENMHAYTAFSKKIQIDFNLNSMQAAAIIARVLDFFEITDE